MTPKVFGNATRIIKCGNCRAALCLYLYGGLLSYDTTCWSCKAVNHVQYHAHPRSRAWPGRIKHRETRLI
jgi:hypothetical protein